MKSKTKSVLVILLCVVVMVCAVLSPISCASQNVQGVEVIAFNAIQGYPSWWVNQKLSNSDNIYFYISSRGNNPYLVRLDAYDKLLSRLVEVLKSDDAIDERYRSELITTSRIRDLALEITNINVYSFSGDTYECILSAECDTNVFYSESKISAYDAERAYESINSLRESAREAYRNNRDYEALTLYLQAASIAEEYPTIQDENSFEDLSYRAKRIVKNIYLSTFGEDYQNGSCYVAVKRAVGIVHPRVTDAKVIGTHILLSGDETDVYECDKRGIVSYKSTARVETEDEKVVFKLSLPEEIDLFKTEKGKDLVRELTSLSDKNEIEFSFKRTNILKNKKIALCVLLYDENNENLNFRDLNTNIENIINENIDINVILNNSNSTLDALNVKESSLNFENVYSVFNDYDYSLVLYGKIDEVNNIKKSMERAVHTKGSLYFYDIKNKSLIYQKGDIDGVGVDQKETEAIKKAFAMCFDYASKYFQNFIYVDLE